MSNLGRADVERITENMLRDLSITVTSDNVLPNRKEVQLWFRDTVISTAHFSTTNESNDE